MNSLSVDSIDCRNCYVDCAEQAHRYAVRGGETIFRKGEPAGSPIFLAAGIAQVETEEASGRRAILALLQPGMLMGLTSSFTSTTHRVSAKGFTDCTVCVLPAGFFEKAVLKRPQLALDLWRHLAAAQQQTIRIFAIRSNPHLPARLAQALLLLGDELGHRHPAGGVLVGITHQQIAELVASTRPAITRVLSTFRSRGWVSMGKGRVILLHTAALSDLTTQAP